MTTEQTAALNRLASRLQSFGLEMTQEKMQQFQRYASELVAWNARYALLSRRDTENVLSKHVAASLGPLLVARPGIGEMWVDVGTGAGLPGLVLKIWDPTQDVTLIDGSRKKCRFLEHVVRHLGIGPIPIIAKRVETVVEHGELVGKFDLLLARAVTDLATTLSCFMPLLKPNGRLVTYKGPRWMDDLAGAERTGAIRSDRNRLEEVVRIPWTTGHLVIVRKVAA